MEIEYIQKHYPDVEIKICCKSIKSAEIIKSEKEDECLICGDDENLTFDKLDCNHFFMKNVLISG